MILKILSIFFQSYLKILQTIPHNFPKNFVEYSIFLLFQFHNIV